LLTAACSGGSDEPSNEITRIDGPAVVDEDEGGADNGATNAPSDG
jgi:hypothetical protein